MELALKLRYTEGTSAVAILGALGIYLLLVLTFGDGSPISGWYVSDGITLFNSAQQDKWLPAAELFDWYQASAVLAILQAWLVGFSPFAPALFNAGVLTSVFCQRWPLLLLGTPYYIAAFVLPSKDVPVLALFTLACVQYDRRRLIIALTLSALTILVRDGFGAIMLAAFLFASTASRLAPWMRIAALGAVTIAASLFWTVADTVLANSFIYARAFAVAQESDYFDMDTSSGPSGYLLRLIGNATNLAFRPVFTDRLGHFNVLSCFYWISGLTLLYALLCCALGVLSRDRRDTKLGLVGLTCLALVAITPYVQPRYLLPLVILIPMFSFTRGHRTAIAFPILAVFSLLASAAYQHMGGYPPPAEIESFSLLN